MKEVSDQGRTVLFVSHNMGAVADLCTRAIMLKQGAQFMDGQTDDVIRSYVKQNMNVGLKDQSALNDPTVRRGNGAVRFEHIEMLNSSDEKTNEFKQGDTVIVKMVVRVNEDIDELLASVSLRSGRTRDVVTSTGRNLVSNGPFKAGQTLQLRYEFNALPLRPGVYETYFWLGDNRAETAFDVVDNLLAPLVVNFPEGVNSLHIIGYFDLPFKFEQKHF
jgi:lipopolysaccharide transport system ATP-binding protein